MDREQFFGVIRPLFGGKMTAKQVAGCEALLDEWYLTNRAKEHKDDRLLAYMMATAFHETDRTMQPIREYGRGRGRKYGAKDPTTGQVYYGRGYVQLTWKSNYERVKAEYGADFVSTPDLALDPIWAAKILFDGCIAGWFVPGKPLSRYINLEWCDYVNARRVVNGTDKADTIAVYAEAFEEALNAANALPSPMPPDYEPPDPKPAEPAWLAFLKALLAMFRK